MQKGFCRRLYKKLKIIFWNKLHILVRLRKFLLRSSISASSLQTIICHNPVFMTIPVFNTGAIFMIVFITTVIHTLGQIDRIGFILIDNLKIGPSHLKKVVKADTFSAEKSKIVVRPKPFSAKKVVRSMAGPAGPPTTAL